MKKNTTPMVTQEIRSMVSNIKPLQPFGISEFKSKFKNYSAVRKAFQYLSKNNIIAKATTGIYYVPVYNHTFNRWVHPTIKSVIETKAKINGWKLLPNFCTILNKVGLSTQVPIKTVLYGNTRIPVLKYQNYKITIEYLPTHIVDSKEKFLNHGLKKKLISPTQKAIIESKNNVLGV